MLLGATWGRGKVGERACKIRMRFLWNEEEEKWKFCLSSEMQFSGPESAASGGWSSVQSLSTDSRNPAVLLTGSSALPGSSRLCKWVYRYLPHAPLPLEEICSQGFLSPAVQCNGLTALVLLPLSHSRVWTAWHQKYEQQEPKDTLSTAAQAVIFVDP